jgi:hypothetical protein
MSTLGASNTGGCSTFGGGISNGGRCGAGVCTGAGAGCFLFRKQPPVASDSITRAAAILVLNP